MPPDSISTHSQIMAALPLAAAVVNDDGLIVAANDLMRELFGTDVVGQHLNLVMRSPALLQAFEEARREARPSGAQSLARGIPSRTIDVSFSPLEAHQHEARHYLVICRDVTREQMVERMRSDFVANASHELRTPLTSLSGFIETMQGAARQDEKARDEFLTLMKAQAGRMSRLIDDLLSLSRIELDEHVTPSAEVNLADVVAQVQNLLQPLVHESDRKLVVDMPRQLLVRGDANQLGQVVHNLIENALKYSGPGKEVTVTGRGEHSMATLSVKDNGPGIAAHHVPRLTERFYRVNAQDSRARGGTGLGLAICKHIINRHRGRLLIESEVGKGSTFSIHLPISKNHAKS